MIYVSIEDSGRSAQVSSLLRIIAGRNFGSLAIHRQPSESYSYIADVQIYKKLCYASLLKSLFSPVSPQMIKKVIKMNMKKDMNFIFIFALYLQDVRTLPSYT